MDAVNETRLVTVSVVLRKFVTIMLLIDLLKRYTFVRGFVSTYITYLPVTKRISDMTANLFKFISFCPITSYSTET